MVVMKNMLVTFVGFAKTRTQTILHGTVQMVQHYFMAPVQQTCIASRKTAFYLARTGESVLEFTLQKGAMLFKLLKIDLWQMAHLWLSWNAKFFWATVNH